MAGRIAAIFDIHSNLPALEAVLGDIRQAGVDGIVVGGDVLPGPMPVETIAALLALDIPTQLIHGTGDRGVLECMRGGVSNAVPEQAQEALRWVAQQLGQGSRMRRAMCCSPRARRRCWKCSPAPD